MPSGESVSIESASLASVPSKFRLDVEGLRGIAVLAVVLFHAGLPGFTGGFVGVDVFFVLSGFLITGLLLDERHRSGRLSFGEFYARRARRLLPASILVFVATIVFATLTMSPLDLLDLRSQARWVALFGSNLWFAAHSTDYLQPDVVSPFQQYWSLAVEEQFYLVWPLVIVLLGLRARSRRQLLRRVGLGLLLVCVASFASAIWLTQVRQPSAFFLLPPRAWELGAGGLLAIGLRHGLRVGRRTASVVGFAGLVAIVITTVHYGATTTFPGWAALPPVLGTVALLLAGSQSFDIPLLTPVLTMKPLTLLGRYSYSIYLWHWPLLVIPSAALGRDLSGPETALCVAASVGLAVATFHLVEDRFRHLRILSVRRSFSYGFGIALVAVAVLSLSILPTKHRISESAARAAVANGDTLSEQLANSMANAPKDQAAVYHNDCHRPTEHDERTDPIDPDTCSSGRLDDPDAVTVLLIGDSHAAHWQPALTEIANKAGWRLISLTRSFCPLVDVTVRLTAANTAYEQCELWRDDVHDLIRELRPAVVILGHRSSFYVGQVGRQKWVEALGRTVTEVQETSDVIVLRDLPNSSESVPKCVLANIGDDDACEFEAKEAANDRASEEQQAVERSGGSFVDPLPIVCPDGRCDAVDNDLVTYSDSNHLTASYSKTLADELAALLFNAMSA